MILRACLTALVVLCAPMAAFAQPLYGNPLSDADTYRATRTATPDATYRIRYEVITTGHNAGTREVIFDIASDWSLTRDAQSATLHDFQLNRIFQINGDSFTTMNGLAALVFRVTERQNRDYLRRVLSTAGAGATMPDDCDADTELGLAIPGATSESRVEVRESHAATGILCDNREIGSFTPSDGATPPAAFWPTAFYHMTAHPELRARIRASGRPPAALEARYRLTGSTEASESWRLLAVETVATPYPLNASMHNATAAQLDGLVAPGAGQMAGDAIAGRALGGAPTLQTWDAHVRDVERSEGRAAAAMLLLPTSNMFPEFSCAGRNSLRLCAIANGLRGIDDPAPLALLEIAMAEQRGDSAAAIAAMQRAQTSPLRDHPTLAASFALALLKFDDAATAQARAANLPTDARALQARALMYLPYNPAYWTDVADIYARNYDFPTAFLFHDVAFSLPMPSALAAPGGVLHGRRTQLERIRRDFPDASLLTTP
jgi:hypothetical protein